MRISARLNRQGGRVRSDGERPSFSPTSVQPAPPPTIRATPAPTVQLAAIVQPTVATATAVSPQPSCCNSPLTLLGRRSTTGNRAPLRRHRSAYRRPPNLGNTHQQHLQLSRAVGAVRVRGRHYGRRLDSLCRLVRRADHGSSTTSCERIGRAASYVQHHRLARGSEQLRRGLDRCRRRLGQCVHLARDRRD